MDSFDDDNKDSYENHLREGRIGRVEGSLKSASQEDDDDWSRQVETDETTGHLGHDDSLRMMESVLEENNNNNEETHRVDGPQPPSQRQLTLKEKLVMRERERRIETERARLKRQFALNNAQDLVEHDADIEGDNDMIRLNEDMLHHSTMEASRDHGSVTDTLGEESIVAHPDEENLDEARLGFNMERFLRNSNTFDPQAKPADIKETPDQGVLMERFLNEPLMPDLSGAAINDDVNRSASLNVDGIPHDSTIRQPLLMPSFDEYNDDLGKTVSSTMVEAHQDNTISRENSVDDHDQMSDIASSTNSHTHHEPRLLRLTEADMEELAAIDEASIGNAPPSDREETLSEIGELAGFADLQTTRFAAEHMSGDTPTTVQDESVTTSLLSGGQNINTLSELDRHSDQRSLDYLGVTKFPSPLAPSPPSSPNDTNRARLPSGSARDEETQVYQYNTSLVHYDVDLKPSSETHEESEELVKTRVGQYRPDNRSVSMEEPHEIDEIRIAAQGSPIPIDTDLTTGHWSPNSGMNVSPLQVGRKIASPRDPIPNYGSLESGEMFVKPSEVYLAQKEAVPLLSKVPPEIVMNGDIPWRQSSEVKLSTVAVLATGIAVGLLVGIIIGATIIPMVAK